MKPLYEYIKVNEDNHSPEEYKEAGELVKQYIGELEVALGGVMGIRNLRLSVTVKRNSIVIESENLLPQLKDGLWNVLFDELTFETWGGNFTNDGMIWFNPKFMWTYAKNSGSNGHDFGFYHNIWFDLEKKQWIYRK